MKEDIEKASKALVDGGIIIYPTDTVWGIGCDATNPKAVEKLMHLKNKAGDKGLIVLIDQVGRLASYVVEVPDLAYDLMEMSEKPLTIVYDKGRNLAAALLAQDGSVGIRVTKDEFCKRLIEKFRKPIVSTSANFSGQPTPAFFSEIQEELIQQADYTVHWRREDKSPAKPSSVIKLGAGGAIKIIRE